MEKNGVFDSKHSWVFEKVGSKHYYKRKMPSTYSIVVL
jgi:hypothetical protein